MAKVDIAETIKFRDVCVMFEKVQKAKIQSKETIIRRYYESFCKHRESFRRQMQLPLDADENGNTSFYSILRLIIPHTDTARDAYGLQLTALGKVYIRVLQLSADSRDAERLHCRSFSTVRGDYADIVYSVLVPRCQREPSNLTLKQIHDILDIIATEDIKSKERELTRFSEIASAEEQKWFIRLLLKSMSLGIREARVFAVLHPLAKEIYQRCSSLKRVCCLLANNKFPTDTVEKLNNNSNQFNLNTIIEPFQQIRPMLCERFPGNIEALMEADVIYMETKMDGERFQLHFADGRFKYISRNGADYTYSFGKNYEEGKLTPHLQNLLPIGLKSIIIDGEMMVWDEQGQKFRDKGENTDVKNLDDDRSWRPCFVAYDLLYLNGHSLLDMTYVQRTFKLQSLLKEQLGVLQLMKPNKITSLAEFNRLFQEALDANAEGIVLKKQNSVYQPGVRVGGGWFKDKADYIKGLTTELDLLIIGGFYNRKRTFIASFLLGVLQPKNAQNKHDEVYSVGKVSNNTRERTVLNDMLKTHWHQVSTEPPPLWYHYKEKSADGRPDVWIEPKQSTILQIKAADLAPSGAFSLAKALHFARTEAWRNDKVWNECMTLQEYTQMIQGQVGIKKITKRELCLEDFTTERKKQKLTVAQKRKIAGLAYEKRFDPKDVEQTSALFDGFSFCILSASLKQGFSKEDLKALAARNGGEIVENPLPNNEKCICIAGDITFYVERLKQKKLRTNDIVTMDWLLRTCERQHILLRPKDMVCMTDALQAQFAESYDKYGDSYTDIVNSIEEMQEILADISDAQLDAYEVDEDELIELESQLFNNQSPNFFRNCQAYFYDTNVSPADKSTLETMKLIFMRRGGKCLHELTQDSFMFICLNNFDVLGFKTWLKSFIPNDKHLRKVQILNVDWISHSHRAKRKLDVCEYLWQTRD